MKKVVAVSSLCLSLFLYRRLRKRGRRKSVTKIYFGGRRNFSLDENLKKNQIETICLSELQALKASYVPKVKGGLAQTCLMAGRMSWLSGGSILRPWYVEYLKLSDGGTCALSWWRPRRHNTEVALVVPGVGNSAETGFVRRLVRDLDAAGFDAACVDLREQGISAEETRSLHSWQDLAEILDHLDGTIYLIGQSLGGACVLSHLGQTKCRRVAAAVVVSAPCDTKKAMPIGLASLLIASTIKLQALLSMTFWTSIFLDMAPTVSTRRRMHAFFRMLFGRSPPEAEASPRLSSLRKRQLSEAPSEQDASENILTLDDQAERTLVFPGSSETSTLSPTIVKTQDTTPVVDKHNATTGILLRKFLFATSVEQINEATVCRYFGYDDSDAFLLAHNPSENLSHIQCPTLVLHALDDPIVPAPDPALFIDSQNNNLALALTKTGGHLAFVDDSGASFSDAVTVEFLSTVRNHLLANSVSAIVRTNATPPKPNLTATRRFHSQASASIDDSPPKPSPSKSIFQRSPSNHETTNTIIQRQTSSHSRDEVSPRLLRSPSLRGIILGF